MPGYQTGHSSEPGTCVCLKHRVSFAIQGFCFFFFFFAYNVSVYKPLLFDFTMLLYERLKDSDLLLLNPDVFYYKCFIIFLGIHELSIYTVKQVLLQIYFPFLFQIGYHINF